MLPVVGHYPPLLAYGWTTCSRGYCSTTPPTTGGPTVYPSSELYPAVPVVEPPTSRRQQWNLRTRRHPTQVFTTARRPAYLSSSAHTSPSPQVFTFLSAAYLYSSSTAHIPLFTLSAAYLSSSTAHIPTPAGFHILVGCLPLLVVDCTHPPLHLVGCLPLVVGAHIPVPAGFHLVGWTARRRLLNKRLRLRGRGE